MKYFISIIFILLFVSCSSPAVYNKKSLSEKIVVSEFNKYYSVIPSCYEMDRALLFYPGGLVEPDAYIPMAALLAEEINIAVFIQKMPMNLAVFGKNMAEKVLSEYHYIDIWYMAGHSLGGVMAASFIRDNPDTFDALFLMASYPMDKKSLYDSEIPVLSISGSEDTIVNRENLAGSLSLLPENTEFYEIKGANHSQFGSYGLQKGDSEALITEYDQQREVVHLIKVFLENI